MSTPEYAEHEQVHCRLYGNVYTIACDQSANTWYCSYSYIQYNTCTYALRHAYSQSDKRGDWTNKCVLQNTLLASLYKNSTVRPAWHAAERKYVLLLCRKKVNNSLSILWMGLVPKISFLMVNIKGKISRWQKSSFLLEHAVGDKFLFLIKTNTV